MNAGRKGVWHWLCIQSIPTFAKSSDASRTAMNHTAHTTALSPKQAIHLLRDYWKLWIIPTVVITLAACVYAVARKATWEASQALIVRNEASGTDKTPGKFNAPDEMKTVQETILEVAKSRGVLAAALREVGPASDCKNPETWPTERDIIDARDNVKLIPPKGAEYGKTEVFYLNVRAGTRERSVALNEAVFKQIKLQSQNLRDVKARSMIEELTKTVALAKTDLDTATAKLSATESHIGSDLGELRSMQETTGGDSALRRSAEDIRAQLRENNLAEKTNRELLVVLKESENDIGRFVATPNRLLESNPSLRRLKDGLVDSQLRTAALLGTMSAENPKVLAAKESEEEIGRHLHSELTLARHGVEVELRVLMDRRALLENQLATATGRLQKLAVARAGYVNEASVVKSREALLVRAEQNLADARAAQAGANAASLISRIDTPDAGIYPIGPSRTMIALAGILGGLLVGLGIVFLAVPTTTATPTTPDNDVVQAFRHNSDKVSSFRTSDAATVHQALQELAR
jgi:polysaccharide biosynthesis transport protein